MIKHYKKILILLGILFLLRIIFPKVINAQVVVPSVVTNDATVTPTSITMNGEIINCGGAPYCDGIGFMWDTVSHPSCSGYDNTWTWVDEPPYWGIGPFSYMWINPGVTYYYRAEARNSAGWGCGSEKSTAANVIDIGLRVYDGTQPVAIAAEPTGTLTSPLRIAKNGVIYGVALVNPGDPNDSGVRIQTSSGIKALRRYP
jgi:hypothetical protein